MGSYST
jgi:14-3-3 protein epsilon